MHRIKVVSSDIASIGYDADILLLEIEFLSGGLYQYHGVPVVVYNAFMKAASYGKFFYQNIRDVYKPIKII
jgi:hypothetical protein